MQICTIKTQSPSDLRSKRQAAKKQSEADNITSVREDKTSDIQEERKTDSRESLMWTERQTCRETGSPLADETV